MSTTELEVKNLSVSFRTSKGVVHAVRDISFTLNKGETLAIVGESGSGKSVTTKAILGIEAPNAVIESGEIWYQQQDLLKYTEAQFTKIRGNKITMVFQDPLSSLDPIVKIGPQLTEASILNGKTNQRLAKKEFNKNIRLLGKLLDKKHVATYKKILNTYGAMLVQDSDAREYADSVCFDISHLKQTTVTQESLALLLKKCQRLHAPHFIAKGDTTLESLIAPIKKSSQKKDTKQSDIKIQLQQLSDFLTERTSKPAPDFLTLAANSIDTSFIKTFVANASHVHAENVLRNLEKAATEKVQHVSRQMAYDKAIRIMEEVGIRDARKRFEQYPFEFSGGMRQRIVIAIAIAANPDILICDEPTTALDVTIQAQIIELINRLKTKRHMSVIFITHDLGVVANVADRIAVMYAGKIVETGTADDIFYRPAHPYTWALLASVPDLDTTETLTSIPGTPPNMMFPPKGDAFAERNAYAMQIDFEQQPPLFKISETHYAATWLLHPDAPAVEMPQALKDRIARMKARKEACNEK